MAALRARAVLLGLVLALTAALSPVAASVTGLHGSHGLAGDGLSGDHVLELLRETAQAERAQVRPEPSARPAFTLWPAPLPENGHLFARAPEPPRLELVVFVPAIASDGAGSLAETRIRAFGLFDPISRPGSNRLSRDNATGYAFGLWVNRVGPTQKGLWTDPVTGMSYARARWYDARNAHWLSEDPMGAVDSTNLYAFVGWQPNMGVDPLGRQTGERTADAAEAVLRDLLNPVPPDSTWSFDDLVRWQFQRGNGYLFTLKAMWVRDYRSTIKRSAAANDLPARLIGGVAFQEVGGDPSWVDDIAYRLRSLGLSRSKPPLFTSFGAISIQLRRAAETFGRDPKTLSESDYEMLIEALKDPVSNIQIAAAHLADIRNLLFPGKSAADLTDEEIKIIATAYNRGPNHSLEELRQNTSYGQAVLKHLKEVDEALAGRVPAADSEEPEP